MTVKCGQSRARRPVAGALLVLSVSLVLPACGSSVVVEVAGEQHTSTGGSSSTSSSGGVGGGTTTSSTSSSSGTTSTSTTTTSSSSSTGPEPCSDVTDCAECQTCAAEGPCSAELDQCSANPACVDLVNCLAGCGASESCLDWCVVEYADGLDDAVELNDCVSCGYCEEACGMGDC